MTDEEQAAQEALVPEVVSKSEQEGQNSEPLSIGRIAVMGLEVPPETKRSDSGKVEKAIRQALKAESRVIDVVEPEPEARVDNARLFSFYDLDRADDGHSSPAPDLASDDSDFEIFDRYTVLRFDQAIEFVARVPTKNQPTYRNISDVPTDTYQVVWTGLVLVVCWEQHDAVATASGGHVVFDLLRDVVAAAGYSVRLQACSPGCRHGFLHTDLVAFPNDDAKEQYSLAGGGSPVAKSVVAPFSSRDGLVSFSYGLIVDLTGSVESFANIVNLHMTIDSLESKARDATSELTRLNFRRASRASVRTKAGIRQRWRQRGERAESRSLIAFLWLLLAQIEDLTRRWDASHRVLMTSLSRQSVAVVLDENALEAENLRSLDLTLIRSAMAESSARHDARLLVVATASGAFAVLAGALVGLLA